MTTFEDWEVQHSARVVLAGGVVMRAAGVLGEGLSDFSGFGEVLVRVTASPRDRRRGAATVTVESSPDGAAWSTVEALAFTAAGTQIVTVTSQPVYLRASASALTGTWRFNVEAIPVATAGGGGSFPTWWTVDSTPGSESVDFAGAVTISPSVSGNSFIIGNGNANRGLSVNIDRTDPVNPVAFLSLYGTGVINLDADDPAFQIGADAGHSGSLLEVYDADFNSLVFQTTGDTKMGFFGAPPAAQPTGVAVDAAGIHAALVTLGLIAA